MAIVTSSTESITFRAPKKEKQDFMKKHPVIGKRSKVLRALLQMYLLGKIPTLVYEEK